MNNSFKSFDDYISDSELIKILSVSKATLKNWIKLNKITPDFFHNSTAYFSKTNVENILINLTSNNSKKLKLRRNKQYIDGSNFYQNYVSHSCKNISIIKNLTQNIENHKINLQNEQINYILADCAIQLLSQVFFKHSVSENFLEQFCSGNITFGSLDKIINNFIDDKNNAICFIKHNKQLFLPQYIYEKNEDIPGLLYISLRNLNARKSAGAYYTPTDVVKKAINSLHLKLDDSKIIDPCCGSGNFLLQLPDTLNPKQIYGCDIDNIAINIARINMALKYQLKNADILFDNFKTKDFLISQIDKKYDFIIGNPPWGAKFSSEYSQKLKKIYKSATTKNIESYDVFLEKSLSSLERNGNIIFILPQAILNVKSHRTIREIILQKTSIKYLEFLGEIFPKVQCPSIILQLENKKNIFPCLGLKVKNKQKTFEINTKRNVTPDIFSFTMDDNEYKIYEKIKNITPAKFLKDNAIFALGIVTGDNSKYITKENFPNSEIILKGSDIEKYQIKYPQRFIKYNPKDFQQCAKEEYYRANEKLFYKFISKKLVFAYDAEKILSLNSCNILIPQINGLDIKYVMAVLNSSIAQFYYTKFNSIKVLRTYLEEIPIPIADVQTQTKIIDLTNKIMNTQNEHHKRELYEEIDRIIAKIYKLKGEDLDRIKRAINEH